MSTEDILIDSANAAAATVGTDDFVKLTKNALSLVGSEMSGRLTPDDSPGLFAPANLEQGGKDRLGGILVLKDRALIAWTEGTFRIKSFGAVVAYDSIANSELGTRPGGPMSKDREVLRIESAQTWTLVFANVFEGGRSIVPFLKLTMDGAITPVFESEGSS